MEKLEYLYNLDPNKEKKGKENQSLNLDSKPSLQQEELFRLDPTPDFIDRRAELGLGFNQYGLKFGQEDAFAGNPD